MNEVYLLPEGISPEEKQAVVQALERYFADPDRKPDPWTLAGRAANARQGVRQARGVLPGSSWQWVERLPLAGRSQTSREGRGDTR